MFLPTENLRNGMVWEPAEPPHARGVCEREQGVHGLRRHPGGAGLLHRHPRPCDRLAGSLGTESVRRLHAPAQARGVVGYLCEQNAAFINTVDDVTRPKASNYRRKSPVIS